MLENKQELIALIAESPEILLTYQGYLKQQLDTTMDSCLRVGPRDAPVQYDRIQCCINLITLLDLCITAQKMQNAQ